MGVSGTVKTQVLLKKDVWLQPSNRIATSKSEFEKIAKFFPVGTIFENKSVEHNPDEDEDCIENSGMHGWCFSLPDQKNMWQYCNFHAYILDYWHQHPELFERFE